MKQLPRIASILLGLIFFIFGLNGFLQFIPVPPIENPAAQAFMGGLMQTGYFFPVLKITEILCGLALLSGYFAPLAMIVISPVVIQIALYHRVLAGGPPMDIFMVILLAVAATGYRSVFAPFMKAKQ